MRRDRNRLRMLKILCLALACLTAGMGVWAVVSTVQLSKLKARVAAMPTGASAGGEETPTGPAASYAPGDAAAEFDGGSVSVAEASAEYETVKSYYSLMGMEESEYAQSAKQELLSNLAEDKILVLKAQEMGVYEVSAAQKAEIEAQAKAAYEENVQYYMQFRYDESKTDAQVREETEQYLNENGYTMEVLIADASKDVWRDNLYAAVTKDLSVGEDELRAFYDEELTSEELAYSADYKQFESAWLSGRAIVWNPAGVRRVQAILIGFDETQSTAYEALQARMEAGEDGALDEVDALYAELEGRAQAVLDRAAQGEDFVALMNESSDGVLPEQNEYAAGGNYVSAQSSIYSDTFRDAAMALAKIGDLSGMVYTDSGIYILRYASDVPEGAVDYETIKEKLRETCISELKQQHYNETVEKWLDEANIRFYTDRF